MAHKFEISNMHKLDNPRRREVLPPDETLRILNINNDDVFVDVGCGIGYFTLPAAKSIGENGEVYAVDISPEMLKVVEEKVQIEKLTNVKLIISEEYSLNLPDTTATIVFTCNVVHEVDDKYRFLSEMKRILKDNGRVVIIDWEKVQSDFGPPVNHRIDKTEIKGILTGLGFREITDDNLNGYFYLITAKK